MQKRSHSLLEQLLKVAIGFNSALLLQVYMFPLFGILIPMGKNILITAIFTIHSIILGYIVRRLFNWITIKHHKAKATRTGYYHGATSICAQCQEPIRFAACQWQHQGYSPSHRAIPTTIKNN